MDANVVHDESAQKTRLDLRVSVTSVVPSVRSAFTLIELLVVVAIIAVLAALLLPVLQGAREKGRQIHCVNDVRQLSVMLNLYTSDHAEFLPVSQHADWDYGGWIKQLVPYSGISTNGITTTFNVPLTSVFYCPVPAIGTWAVGREYRWTYAMNHDLRQRYGSSSPASDGMKLTDFRDHAKTMALTENGFYADVINAPFLEYGLYGHPPPSQWAAGPAHGGKGIPFAYLDGHAEFCARVPPYAQYMTDANIPWTHKSFWGNSLSITGAEARCVETAPYP